MSRYYRDWAPYVPVAERRRKAERALEKRRKAGHAVAPVRIAGRTIATTFWGKAWCDNMESYHDFENRLPRGRTYVRNGSVVDLQISPGRVTAVVSGSELYDVAVTIKETPKAQWRSMCMDCAGGIDSLVELLQGRFSKAVMERLCRQQGGLFPQPSDIHFSCSCPDYAAMCKHVAAVLYGVGARLDHQPELLFRLRAVDATDLLGHVDAALPMSAQGLAAGRRLETDDVSALFGLDMAAPTGPATGQPSDQPRAGRSRRKPETSAAKAAVPETAGSKRAAAGRLPAKPDPATTATPATGGPGKPVVLKKKQVAVRATPPGRPASKQGADAKMASGPVVPDKGARPKSGDERDRAGALRQAKKPAPIAPSNVAEVPARGRGRPPGSKIRPASTAATDRKSKPKPAQWS